MEKSKYSYHHSFNQVKINDSFWNNIIELVRTEVIPYQYNALLDNIEGAEKSYCIENFIKAGKIAKKIKNNINVPVFPVDKWCYDENNSHKDAFHGWVFQDSDVYKWLEAVGFSLGNHPDKQLEDKADKFIDIICSAQLENGYLDTLYIINDRTKVFTNLKDFHELYCFGHLAEAGISYYKATGKRKLLDACCKYADLICNTFGENKMNGYPGHEIAEMALVKLYKVTNNKKYLETARFFINQRGKKPYYYDYETNRQTDGTDYIYNQAHIEPRYQDEALGHAVRGVYLYSAMADIAKEYNDEELFIACKSIWNNIENKKMYITGGIGSTVDGEAFSYNYDLPNDLAYCETCASIGLVFFARRMNEIEPNSKYAKVIERALYNTILSGMSLDGKSFFYVNPLEVLPEASNKDSRKKHIKTVRQKWFNCACCPPNLARLISSLNEYISTENDNTIFINQLIGCEINSNKGIINIDTDSFNDGKLKIKVNANNDFKIAVRIPEYLTDLVISKEYVMNNGYAYFDITDNIEIAFSFKNKPRIIKCSNRVRENIGKIAVMKGPFVYCIEEIDNGKNLHLLSISPNTDFKEEEDSLITEGFRELPDDNLYFEYEKSKEEQTVIKFIPYYKWANRGENEMTVYVRMNDEKV